MSSDISEIRAFISARYRDKLAERVAEADALGLSASSFARINHLSPWNSMVIGHESGAYFSNPLAKYKRDAYPFRDHPDYRPEWLPTEADRLVAAVGDLKTELVKASRIERVVGWIARHVPRHKNWGSR